MDWEPCGGQEVLLLVLSSGFTSGFVFWFCVVCGFVLFGSVLFGFIVCGCVLRGCVFGDVRSLALSSVMSVVSLVDQVGRSLLCSVELKSRFVKVLIFDHQYHIRAATSILSDRAAELNPNIIQSRVRRHGMVDISELCTERFDMTVVF